MSLRRYSGLGLILVCYLALTLAYSYAIPFSKGPDEYINYQYILFIAKHHRLPATLAEKQEAGVKADWQPLYHLVAGLAAAPVDLTPPPELKVTWQPPTRQLIDLVLPRATLVRTEDERSPYRGVYAVWQVGRWVSLVLGAGTLIVTYFICLILWPEQPALAVGTTALLVFIPRFLFNHAVLSDDTLMGFLLLLYVLLLVRLVRGSWSVVGDPLPVASNQSSFLISQSPNPGENFSGDLYHPPMIHGGRQSTVGGLYWLFAGLGLTVGLAVVAKFTAIPAVAGTLIAGALLAHRQKWPWRKRWLAGSTFAAALALALGWWVGWVGWYFNQVDQLGPVWGMIKPFLPGTTADDNPTTTRLTAFLSGQSLADWGEAPGAGGNFFDWAWHSFITFWGVTVFGADPGWPYPYWIILGLLALFCLVAIVGLGRAYRRASPVARSLGWVFALYALLFFPIPLLRFALSHRLNDAAQGRHLLFPAGPVIAILLMTGWLAWFRPQQRSRVALMMGGFMLAWGVGHWFYLASAYPPPLPVRTTPGPQMQGEYSIQVQFGDVLELTSYQTQLINQGTVLQVDLFWRSLAPAWEDYRTEITLVNPQNQPRLRWISHPAAGRFPVRAWQPGDLVRDSLFIPLAGLNAGDYTLNLRLLGWDNPLPSRQGETLTLTTVTLDTIPTLPGVALWQQGHIIAGQILPSPPPRLLARFASLPPIYRHYSTIPVTLAEAGTVSLLGPTGQVYSPAANIGPLQLFMVDDDWPGGNYRLQIGGQDSGLTLQVENFPRNFASPAMMAPVQANFADKIELLGYDLPQRRVKAGEGIPLVLYWRGLARMREDYTIFVQLLDADLQRRGGYDRFPRENYNTYLWVPGAVVDDGFAVPVNPAAPDGVYTIRVGLYRQVKGQAEALPLVQNGETSVVIGPVKVGGPPVEVSRQEFSPDHSLTVDLGQVIRLAGYDLSVDRPVIRLKLYWASLAQPPADYTVFVHLRDGAGQTVAQSDGPPLAGRYPTSLWDSGEVIPAEFTLNLPVDLKPGTYQLVAGLYDPATGVRLAVPGVPDNSIFLTGIDLNR